MKTRRIRALSILVVIFGLLLPSIGITKHSNKDYAPEPKYSELLDIPITLSNCLGVKIVEWKTSKHDVKGTGFSETNIAHINELCLLAITKYPEFIKLKFNEDISASVSVTVSVLPADITKDGMDFRNLNDIKFGFSKVWKDCCYWGFYMHKINHFFIRNDVTIGSSHMLNSNFKRTFLHEFCHAQNALSGIKSKFLNNSDEEDEKFVREYLVFIGVNPDAD